MSETRTHPASIQEKKGLIFVSKIASYVFHPVFMPLIMMLALYYFNPASFKSVETKTLTKWIMTVSLNTIFFPLVTVFLLKKLNFIDSIYLKTPKDRIIPLMGTMIFYFWVYMLFKNFDAHLTLRVLFLGNFWGIILIFLINIFKKISMHAAAAGGMIGIIIVAMIVSQVNLLFPLALAIIVAGIIGTSRLTLRAHTTGEIGLGYIMGIISQLAAYIYLTKLVNMFS